MLTCFDVGHVVGDCRLDQVSEVEAGGAHLEPAQQRLRGVGKGRHVDSIPHSLRRVAFFRVLVCRVDH